jgi:hypothetical protein
MKCKKHPKYQAKRKPTTNCIACWTKYINEHMTDTYDLSVYDMMAFVETICSDTGIEQLKINLITD